jgi:hypothetical protein
MRWGARGSGCGHRLRDSGDHRGVVTDGLGLKMANGLTELAGGYLLPQCSLP